MGSPQHLRQPVCREEEVASPNPDSREVLSVGRSDSGGSSHTSTTSSKGQKDEKSPEIVVDEVSGSSMSTSSFDVSIQLLNETSPPQILLKAMESLE
jgi:hypothetical protein